MGSHELPHNVKVREVELGLFSSLLLVFPLEQVLEPLTLLFLLLLRRLLLFSLFLPFSLSLFGWCLFGEVEFLVESLDAVDEGRFGITVELDRHMVSGPKVVEYFSLVLVREELDQLPQLLGV